MNERLQFVTFEELLSNPKRYLKPLSYWWIYANPNEYTLGELIYRISIDNRGLFVVEELTYMGEERPHYGFEYPHLRKWQLQNYGELTYLKGKTGIVSCEKPENIKIYQIHKR